MRAALRESERQLDEESGPLADLRLGPEVAAVLLGDLAADAQAAAGPEARDELPELFFGDSRTGIPHGEADVARARAPGADFDDAAGGRELDRVRDEIVQEPLQKLVVRADL